MRYLATILINKYNVKCYKKNKNDKLYSFIFKVADDKYIYDDLEIDRIICKEFMGLSVNELRGIKRYLRMYCDLAYITKEMEK